MDAGACDGFWGQWPTGAIRYDPVAAAGFGAVQIQHRDQVLGLHVSLGRAHGECLIDGDPYRPLDFTHNDRH